MTDILSRTMTLEGTGKSAMEVARTRLIAAGALFLVVFMAMAYRTVELGLSATPGAEKASRNRLVQVAVARYKRSDIVDRNGEILATNLASASLYANAHKVDDISVTAQKLVKILPTLTLADVERKLKSGKDFVWLKRHLTPEQKWQINAIGNPALKFKADEVRVYPHGNLAAHVLGHVDIDGNGIAGLEHYFNGSLDDAAKTDEPLKLSLDIRVQHALADELSAAVSAHQATGGAGIVMDVNSGELLAMVSLPDFDPNNAGNEPENTRVNRAAFRVYELGSTFKTFTIAAALDDGIINMEDSFNAVKPLNVGPFTISDDHPKKRYLRVPEIFAYSSNIGMARIADTLGADRQKEFLSSLGMLKPAKLELTEVGRPVFPQRWKRLSSMTISYGHGISVSPVQLSTGIATMVNGGRLIPATLVAKNIDTNFGENAGSGQIISAATSRKIRQMLRVTVRQGTGSKADATGYRVGGKTGTAEKASGGSYDRDALISSFVGVFPMDDPKYLVFVLLDEPKGIEQTFGFSGGGWTAAPVVKNVILRTAPLLGVKPSVEDETLYKNVALLFED